MGVQGVKRFGLLQAAKDSDYVKKVYGGYFNVYRAAFEEEGEIWDLYRVIDGEFPDINDLQKYDGFVISGSPVDAYGNDYWVLKLCLLLQALDAMEKKVLGVCFGHQILCRALGGKVARSYTGWDLGLRTVNVVKDLVPRCFLDDFGRIPASLSVIECHQDEVFEVPLGAEVIASSDKTGVEMFKIEDHILGIQGHPEYTKDILHDIIDRLLNTNDIERDFAEKVKISLEAAEPDRKCWERICRNFLKGR